MESLLNALAHDNFVSLVNHRTHWVITYREPGKDEYGTLTSKTLDNLLSTFEDMVEKWDSRCTFCSNADCGGECIEYEVTDEGVEEMTAGIAPNAGGDAIEPLTTKYGVPITRDASGRPMADRPERYLP